MIAGTRSEAKVSGARSKRRTGGGLTPNRRELLQVAGALVAAFGIPEAAFAQSLDSVRPYRAIAGADAFHDVSVALTGYAPADRSLVAAFYEAFESDIYDLQRLYAIIRATPPEGWDNAIGEAGLAPLAEALIEAWYTGMVGEGSGQRVVTYLNAFVWYAVGYTKPPSECDTNFGAWANRPPGDF
jgi:hypothetical protein